MIAHHLLGRAADRVVRAGLIGAGHYGTAILAQSAAIAQLDVPVIADVDVAAALAACRRAGFVPDQIAVCESRAAALRAIEAGQRAVVPDGLLLADLPIDVLVEATGSAEAGARHAAAAINNGKHVAMVTKEADAVVGPILQRRAEQRGLVYTPVDGDQHGLLIGLVAWARALGLQVLCGGKARDAEFVYDAAAGTVACGEHGIAVAPGSAWCLAPIGAGDDVAAYVQVRREVTAGLPQLGGFDCTELAIAANASGLRPDVAALHAPTLRTVEIPQVLCPRECGGILSSDAVVDAVTCLRGPHEPGLGGGVFVVVSCANDYARMIVATKGALSNTDGSAALIYRPYHLCGVETPLSILCAGLLGLSTGVAGVRPAYDVVAVTTRDLPAGTLLGGDHSPDLQALVQPVQPAGPEAPLPLHMATGHRLVCPVPAGTLLTYAMIHPPPASTLWLLRAEQDRLFIQ